MTQQLPNLGNINVSWNDSYMPSMIAFSVGAATQLIMTLTHKRHGFRPIGLGWGAWMAWMLLPNPNKHVYLDVKVDNRSSPSETTTPDVK